MPKGGYKGYRDAVILAVLSAGTALLIYGREMALSVLLGSILAIGNFAFIVAFVHRIIIMRKGRAIAVFSWLVKLLVLVAILWVALIYFRMNAIALLVGLTLPIIPLIFRYYSSCKEITKDA